MSHDRMLSAAPEIAPHVEVKNAAMASNVVRDLRSRFEALQEMIGGTRNECEAVLSQQEVERSAIIFEAARVEMEALQRWLDHVQVEQWTQDSEEREVSLNEMIVALNIPTYHIGKRRDIDDDFKRRILVVLDRIEAEWGCAAARAFQNEHHLWNSVIEGWRRKLNMPKKPIRPSQA